HRQTYRLLALPPEAGGTVNWATAQRVAGEPGTTPQPGATWGAVPESLNTSRKLKPLQKPLEDFLYNDARLVLLENAKLGLVGLPGEDVVAFRERCRTAARQEAEKGIAAERLKYQPKFEALGAKIPEGPEAEQGGSLLNIVNPLSWLGL